MEKMYCGMDIHKDTITGCVLNKEGTIIRHHTFRPHKDSITTFLYNLSNADTEIAMETCGTWRGIYKILAHLGYTVKLADPRKIHCIAGNKKTDKGDAHILADLLRTHYLPEVYIPPQDILHLKDLTRHKVSLTRLRTQLQTKIKAYLLREGIDYKKTIWNKKNLADIAQHHPNLTNLVTLYQSFKKEEYEVMTRITNQAQAPHQLRGPLPRHPPIRRHRKNTKKQRGQQISQMDPLRMLRTGSHARPKNPKLLLQHQTQKRIQNSTTSHRPKTPHHHLAHTHQERTLSSLTVHILIWTQ